MWQQTRPQLPSNYQPISLTSIVIKIIERIYNSFWINFSFRISHNLISFCHFGFHKNHSTTYLLLELKLYMTGPELWSVVMISIICAWIFLKHSTVCHTIGFYWNCNLGCVWPATLMDPLFSYYKISVSSCKSTFLWVASHCLWSFPGFHLRTVAFYIVYRWCEAFC